MRTTRFVAMVSLLLAVASTTYAAQQGGGGAAVDPYHRMYNPATAETVRGTVAKVQTVRGRGMQGGIHLLLKTEKETVPVHLGPAWFMEKQELKVAAGDSVEVKGSRVAMGGKPAIIASEVKKGDHVLKLRDENGVPVWAGARRR